uniref:Uncharacterized protein n=1 Tax=Bombyx mori TaxID=7091 RepID=A0A8R2QRA7_BOMMO|nr:radial spoke head 10 homolog B-like isoform X2 [Bombyx mori]
MYYVDSQRTLTRRDSSLVFSKKSELDEEFDVKSTARGPSTIRLTTDDSAHASVVIRPKGSVQKELVTLMFESMLDSIVESWQILTPLKQDENLTKVEKTPSDLTSKKKKTIAKTSKTKKSRSKMEFNDFSNQNNPSNQVWWNGPDERVVIKFKNGNVYEGNISMKCMHGEGRFQWADGTIYLGHFKDNEINGKGLIKWKDDTWYEGDFSDNLRHGKGLYVDSRRQRCFLGDWHCGTKHGRGVMNYSETFKNSYDGQWNHNVRHGFGSREYSTTSGYKGEWDRYLREGKGLMIWPNHDGQRNGYGILNLGLGASSHYRGEFQNNKKNGTGKFVTNNGLVLQHKTLFLNDNLSDMAPEEDCCELLQQEKHCQEVEPFLFDICADHTIGLAYHVEEAIKNIDKGMEDRSKIINDYLESNMSQYRNELRRNTMPYDNTYPFSIEDFIDFEVDSLQKSLRCYETELKVIYYKYATIFNKEEINFTPVLIRFGLWQLFFDCNVHEKGLTLVEIDKIFHKNPQWLARTPHNPFEEIYFWQFLHSILSVATKLYALKELPKTKPDTLLSTALRQFIEKDVWPNVGRCKGRLSNAYINYIPLKGSYELYKAIGEPHTIRNFLCAIRRSMHILDDSEIKIIETSNETIPTGRNVFLFSDEITFVTDYHNFETNEEKVLLWESNEFKLLNFAQLSSKSILNIFSKIFPNLYDKNTNKIINLDIHMTFFEFFEVIISCAEESVAQNVMDAEFYTAN